MEGDVSRACQKEKSGKETANKRALDDKGRNSLFHSKRAEQCKIMRLKRDNHERRAWHGRQLEGLQELRIESVNMAEQESALALEQQRLTKDSS